MRILVIEDERKIAQFIKRGLKEEGYAVDLANDGQEGHFLATTNDYDVIILDVMIPVMDGISLCKQLRKEKVVTPIIMLTAKADVEDKVEGLDAGADDYLTKPFAFEELLARLRVHLRKTKSDHTAELVLADLKVNLLTQQVLRANKLLELTTKEYALLVYLLRHQGQVVTRTQIAEHVWDIHFDSDTNVIDVYVNYLRRKIDESFDVKLLHTIRGRGYTLKSS